MSDIKRARNALDNITKPYVNDAKRSGFFAPITIAHEVLSLVGWSFKKTSQATDSAEAGRFGWLFKARRMFITVQIMALLAAFGLLGKHGFISILAFMALGFGAYKWHQGWRPWGEEEPAPADTEHIGGSSSADGDAVAAATNDGTGQQIMLGYIPMPRNLEPLGVAVVGAPGGGKSQTINGNLATIRTRGERAFILDNGGEAMSGWMEEGDIIMSPIDARGVAWSPFAEIAEVWDCAGVAQMIVGPEEGAEGFKAYAAQILGGIFERLLEKGETKNRNLLYWTTQAPQKELGKLLKGSPVSRLFEEGNERYLGTVLGIIGQVIAPFRYLDPEAGPESFSLKKWVLEKNSNWVWVPYKTDTAAMLLPLMQCWTEVVSSALLSNETDLQRRVWFIIDELASAGHLVQLPALAALGRKKGASFMLGFQSIAQLDKIYGEESRNILKNCLQSTIAFAVSDTATAQFLVETFGKTRYKRREVSDTITHTADGPVHGQSVSYNHVEEDLLTAADFEKIPPLMAYVKLKGMPATKTHVGIAEPVHFWPTFERKQAAAVAVGGEA